MSPPSLFSVVIPVYDGGDDLIRCLEALRASTMTDYECIVVDDGSRDGSGEVARRYRAQVLETGGPLGPAAARNRGAAMANGEFLFFVDADCEVHPDTLENARRTLEADPGLDGLFGSYDTEPAAPGAVSQFKNLFHHWVHQQADGEADTFWAGCGVVRRSRFEEVGGFDADRYARPSIEDIELGYRLAAAGARVVVARDVQVRHLKRWRLWDLVRTDVFRRGVPWTRLMLERGRRGRELNVDRKGRLSVALVGLALVASAAAWVRLEWLALVALALVLVALLNLRLYLFFARCRGLAFLVAAVPLHVLYCFYSGCAYVLGVARHLARV
ncbi:MAG: glycosyltransferase family A protein [Thermoanaerobaculia bacterium]|nr:glycosyltransferase family A protein [Thermoanaerobaculia bacterium]